VGVARALDVADATKVAGMRNGAYMASMADLGGVAGAPVMAGMTVGAPATRRPLKRA